MNGIWRDIRHAIRGLRKAPGFLAIVILTLGLGIGANAAIFSLMDQILLRPLAVHNPSALVLLDGPGAFLGRTTNAMTFSYPMYRDLRDRNEVFTGVLARFPFALTAVWRGASERANGDLVSGNYFEVLGVQPALGRVFNASDDRTWYPATTFDGVVHEMTHAVCESMWGAWSWDVEPGAISEGIADVFAAIAEHERKAGPENLLLGEQAVVPRSGQCKAIRDLVHPKACGGVDHAQDLITGSASVSDFFDRCSTGDASHENGGVVGNAFALMTVGGTNESSGVTIAKGIGWEAAKTVWWTALEAMSKDSRFENLANLTIGVAQKNRLDLTPVICAWFAVGVLNADDVATHKVTCTPPEPTAAADAGIAIDAGVAADAAPGTVVIPPGGAASGPWICMLTTDGNCTCLMRVLAGVGMEMEQARGTVKIVPACTAAMVPGPAACALAKSSGHPAICGCAKNVAGTAAMKFGAVEWSPVPRCPPP